MGTKITGTKFIDLLIKHLPEEKMIEYEILLIIGNKRRILEFIGQILSEIEVILLRSVR